VRSPGIHTRLLLTGFLIISATALTLGFMGVKMFHEFAITRFEDRFQFLARYLALNAELGILIEQPAMLDRLAANLLSERDVVRVVIFDQDGRRLAESAKQLPGPFAKVSAPVHVKEINEEIIVFDRDFSSGMISTPANVIGKVELEYSTYQINSLIKKMTGRFILLSAAFAALGLAVFYLISRSLVYPLTRLADTARRVGAGNRDLRMEAGNLPETRELSLAFNSMLDSLDRARKKMEKTNQEMARKNMLAEMGKFSMMIAHEIKNPLGIIKSSFDVMRKDPTDPANEILIGYVDEEIVRMNKLIEDFLSFARPSKPSFRVVDTNRMLRDCLERFSRRPEASGIRLECDISEDSCISYLDPDLCLRAIDNILKNALEACQAEGEIRVTARCHENSWQVVISDSGKGISEKVLEKIFDPFVTTRARGTGLGLAYTAQVIAAHGGWITAENINGQGACFTLEVPREPGGVNVDNSREES